MNRQKCRSILEKELNKKRDLMIDFEDDIDTTRLILFEVYSMIDFAYRIGDITRKERENKTEEIDQFWENL